MNGLVAVESSRAFLETDMGIASYTKPGFLLSSALIAALCLQPLSAKSEEQPQPSQLAVLLASAKQDFDFVSPAASLQETAWKSELLVDALIQVESAGNSRRVGLHGERGLMQLKLETWNQVSEQVFAVQIPFDMAFDPDLNRLIGKAYLSYLTAFLDGFRSEWRADERTLLLACYNYGPNRVKAAGFNPTQMPAVVKDYISRVSALHDDYLRRSTVPAEFAMANTPDW